MIQYRSFQITKHFDLRRFSGDCFRKLESSARGVLKGRSAQGCPIRTAFRQRSLLAINNFEPAGAQRTRWTGAKATLSSFCARNDPRRAARRGRLARRRGRGAFA